MDGCIAAFPGGTSMTSMCTNMLAGKTIPAGRVCIEIQNSDASDTAKITYNTTGTAYCLKDVKAYVGESIPVERTGNAATDLFPAKTPVNPIPDACAKTYTVTTTLPKQCSVSTPYTNWVLRLAAQASVQFSNGTGVQTAWSVGPKINLNPKGCWGMYTPLTLNCNCVAPTKAPTVAPTKVPTKVS